MDVAKYISSGILESYVLGVASRDESNEVEAMAAHNAEVKKEIESIRNAMESYALAHQKAPPAHLKNKILNEIEKREAEKEKKEARVIEMDTTKQNDRSKSSRWMAAASISLLVLSGTMNVLQYNKLNEASEKIAALESEKSLLADEFNMLKANYSVRENDLAILTNPNIKTVVMKGVGKHPDALALVYWNSQTKETFLAVNNLPVPPSDGQYELWAIVDGKPVDLSVFDVTASLQKMKTIESAQAFAVTLEKKGGSPVPTMEQMYVMGNV